MRRFLGLSWMLMLAVGPMMLGAMLVGGCDETDLVKPVPVCEVSPASLQFGEVEVGSNKDLAFTIQNVGTGVLRGTVSDNCDRFSILEGAGDYMLGEGEELTVTVRFNSAEPGDFDCVVHMGDQACEIPMEGRAVRTVVPPPPDDDHFIPAPVTDLRVIATEPNSVTLRWTAVGDDGLLGRAARYDLRYSVNPNSTWENATLAVGFLPEPGPAGYTETFTVDFLTPATTYYFWIRVVDEAGNWSDISDALVVTTDPAPPLPPGRITDLDVEDVTENTVTLVWTAPAGDFNSAYDLRMGTMEASAWEEMVPISIGQAPGQPGDDEQFTVEGLEPNRTYYFRIATMDIFGDEANPSNRVIVTTDEEDLTLN